MVGGGGGTIRAVDHRIDVAGATDLARAIRSADVRVSEFDVVAAVETRDGVRLPAVISRCTNPAQSGLDKFQMKNEMKDTAKQMMPKVSSRIHGVRWVKPIDRSQGEPRHSDDVQHPRSPKTNVVNDSARVSLHEAPVSRVLFSNDTGSDGARTAHQSSRLS
jgi:hypothetical protein